MRLDNIEKQQLIDRYGNSKRNREIIRMKWIDGETYERVAEEFDMSPRQIWNILHDFMILAGLLR